MLDDNTLDSKKIVEDYVNKKDWRVTENSNSPYSFGGLNKYIIGEVSKDHWLRHVYPKRITDAYLDGRMHIHDLSGLGIYCCGYSLKDIIMMGVQGVPNIPTSSPAKHFDAILNQLANLVTVFQNEIMGAVAFNSFDTLLAPFVKVDKLSYKEIRQSMQNFIFSINSNSRGGAEPAFSNITFDLTPSEDLLNKNAIVGGEAMDFTYKQCQPEIDLINKAFFELMSEGDARKRPFAYPIPTYNIHQRFDWDNPKNDLLWEMTGKYGYPYFANFLNSDMDPSDVRSMCPLASDTKMFVKNKLSGIRIEEISKIYQRTKKGSQYQVFTKSGWQDAKIDKYPITKTLRISFSNGSTVKMGINHLQPTKDFGTLMAKDLKEGMWIPFNKTPIDSKLGDYDLGYAIGAFVGDGSSNKEGITYSLCAFEKDDKTEEALVDFWSREGFNTTVTIGEKNVRFLRVSCGSEGIVRRYVDGDSALNKHLKNSVYNSSLEFKKGLLDGFIVTDGSREKKRLYTSSVNLKEDMCCLLASMGKKYMSNYEDNREGRLGINPNYRIDYPERANYKNLFNEDEKYHYYIITSIEDCEVKGNYLYCVELADADKLFVLANGLVTHNCRLQLNLKELRRRNGGLFGSGDSTGSIGVVTINLPRLAYLSKGNKERFYKNLSGTLDLAKDSLEIKRQWLQKNVIDNKLIPAFCTYVGTLKNHFSTIGVVGMNEMCENFLGKDKDILTKEGKDFTIEVSNFIRKKLVEYQEETGNLYNYEATPAESTCYRLAKKDKEEFNDIITRGTNKAPYYTNSCHIPVNKVESIKQVFDNQDDLQTLFTGGTVVHLYMNGAISGKQAKSIVKSVCTNYKVPYMSISPLNRYCPVHGYIEQRVDKCPKCGKPVEMYQRITGYLRKVENFNPGKKSEFNDRHQL